MISCRSSAYLYLTDFSRRANAVAVSSAFLLVVLELVALLDDVLPVLLSDDVPAVTPEVVVPRADCVAVLLVDVVTVVDMASVDVVIAG
jgi:hypothetical protein